MKNIINIIFLFPILLYVILLLINSNLLTWKETINIFWIIEAELPIVSIISLFFISYIFILYFGGKFSSFFTNSKIKSIENDKLKLKSELADKIPEIEKTIDDKYWKILDEFKNISNKNLELHKNQTKQVLENLEFEIKNIKDKLNK